MDAKTYAIFKKLSSGSADPVLQDKEVTITENGETTVEADSDYDGLSSVNVTTNIPDPVLQDKEITITENGETTVEADSDYDGLNSVDITVAVPEPSGSIDIIANGTYDVTEKASAVVNVPSSGPSGPYTEETFDSDGYFVGITFHGYTKLRTEVCCKSLGASGTGNRLTSVVFDSCNLTELPNGAFYSCDYLENIAIPNSVTVIGTSCFYRCSRLSNITLPDSLTTIGNSAFSYCSSSSIKSLTLPRNIRTIGNYAFSQFGDLLDYVTFNGTPDSIGTTAFANCTARVLNVPWAENEVEGAPWTGNFFKINYNYTGA